MKLLATINLIRSIGRVATNEICLTFKSTLLNLDGCTLHKLQSDKHQHLTKCDATANYVLWYISILH